MNIRLILCSVFFCILLSGCFQANSDDDLRGVPVTNNPNLIPKANQTPGQSF